ncbi:galectin-3-binding protein-like [Styela clava]
MIMWCDCDKSNMEDTRKQLTPSNQSSMTSSEGIITSMSKYFNNPEMSDVTLKLGETRYYAHKFVLGLMSDVFRTMCSQRWDGDHNELEIQECEECVPIFESFLRFLYCGDIEVDITSALPLLMLADKYNVQPLKNKFEQYMNKTVKDGSVTGALRWLSYAQVSGHGVLQNACVDVVVTKMDEVVSSEDFLRLEHDFLVTLLARDDLVVLWEKTIFGAVVRWVTAQYDLSTEQLQSLLCLIRMPMMLPEQLYEIEISTFCQTYKQILTPMLANAHRFRSIATDVHSNSFSDSNFRPRNYTHRLWCYFLTVDTNGETFYENSVGVPCVNHPVLSPPEQYWQIRIRGEKKNPRSSSSNKSTVLPNLGYVFTPTTSMMEKSVPLVMTVTPLRPIKHHVVVDVSLYQVKKEKIVRLLCESSIKFAPEEYFMRIESGDRQNKFGTLQSSSNLIPQQSPPRAGPPKFSPTPMNFAVMFQQSQPMERHEVNLHYNFLSHDLDHPAEVPCFKFNGPLRMTNSVRVAIIFKPRFVTNGNGRDISGSSQILVSTKEVAGASGTSTASIEENGSGTDLGNFPL